MPLSQEANLLRRLRKIVTAHGPGQPTDRQLLQRFLADSDEAAFAAVVQRHGAMVLGVCRSVLGHHQDAEDALQATFLVLARKAHSIRKLQSLASWLHGVAYRLALKAKMRASKRPVQEQAAAEPIVSGPVDDLTVRELQAILHEELERLPEKYRTPILLCYWEGKTRDEAAEQLGWAKGTFKEQLERARNLLRGRLTRRGLVPSAALFTALLTETAAQAVISSPLIETTTKSALAFAAGKAALGSAAVTTLAEGVIRTMQFTKWAMTAFVLIVLGTLGSGIGFLALTYGGAQADAQPEAVAKQEETGKDGQPKAAGKDAAKEELQKLQGVWEVKSFEYKNVSKAAGPYAYIFKGEKFTFERNGKILYEGTVKLVPAKKPKSIDLVIVEGEGKGETNLGLYDLEGDALKIAFNPGGKERPKELKTGADADTKIWHYQRKKELTDRQKDAPDSPPNVEWNGHNKGLPRSKLKIELTPGAKVERTKTGLSLPVKISNESKETIVLKVPHEWHGGEWPTTDLYAWVEKQTKAKTDVEAPFRVLYQFGERAGKATELTTLEQGKSIDLNVRMDWPGTGSVQGTRLMEPADHGTFRVRLLLVFEAGKNQQYVIGAAKAVELPAQEVLPKVKDADADAWLKANIDSFKLTLGGPPFLIFAVKPLTLRDGPPDGTYSLTKAEAAGIVQALVDTGLWSRPDTLVSPRFPARYLDLGNKSWMLGRIDEDISSRVIIQHLLKLGGQREKAIRTWLEFRPKPPPPREPKEPKASPFVRRIDHGDFEVKRPHNKSGKPGVFISADELAKAFPKKQADHLGKQVDFAKERLVYFAWSGAGDTKLSFRVLDGEKVTEVIFRITPGEQTDKRTQVHLFAVSNDATMRLEDPTEPRPIIILPLVRRIDLSGYAIRPKKSFIGAPVQIATDEELVKAFPDKEWRERINKQVDFKKDRLLFFAWEGADDADLAFKVLDAYIAPLVIFRFWQRDAKETRSLFHLYALPKDAKFLVKFLDQNAPEGSVGDAAARPPLVRDLHHWIDGPDLGHQAVYTSNPLPEAIRTLPFEDRINIRDSFPKERFVAFSWRGGADSKMTFEVQTDETGPVVIFHRKAGKVKEDHLHTFFYAVANEARFRVEGDPQPPAGPPIVRRLDVGPNNPNALDRYRGPAKIASKEMLAKAIPDKQTQERVNRQIDFTKEYLVCFAWSGSAGDTYSFKINSGVKDGKEQPIVAFRFQRSADKGERNHFELFAISNTAILDTEVAR